MIWPFKRLPTIGFHSLVQGLDKVVPVVPATRMKPEWFRQSEKRDGTSIRYCAGISDYIGAGYIVPAWTDMTFKANSAGVAWQGFDALFQPPEFMDERLLNGYLRPKGVVAKIVKVPSPWLVKTKPGWSAYVLPAVYDTSLPLSWHVYGGINDYDDFHTLNFMFTPREPGEWTIWRGTPLLQVIPFKREPVTSQVCEAAPDLAAYHRLCKATRKPFFYHRTLHKKKVWR